MPAKAKPLKLAYPASAVAARRRGRAVRLPAGVPRPPKAGDDEVGSAKAKLAALLDERRRQLRLNQTRAAERLGLSQSDVSKLARGRVAGYSLDRLFALLNALGTDLDVLAHPPHPRRKGVVQVLEVVNPE